MVVLYIYRRLRKPAAPAATQSRSNTEQIQQRADPTQREQIQSTASEQIQHKADPTQSRSNTEQVQHRADPEHMQSRSGTEQVELRADPT